MKTPVLGVKANLPSMAYVDLSSFTLASSAFVSTCALCSAYKSIASLTYAMWLYISRPFLMLCLEWGILSHDEWAGMEGDKYMCLFSEAQKE